jgi:peptide-methionine (S)-S-oxide reductase
MSDLMNKTRLITLASVLALSMAAPAFSAANMATAVFAGGCFWTMEHKMDAVPGVKDVVSGYGGGPKAAHPTYENHAGFLESVKVTYDPSKISYRKLVDYYWRMIDPTDTQGMVCDLGPTYKSAIFVGSPAEKMAAEASKESIDNGKRATHIATKILPLTTFVPAEAYHQDYAKKNPAAYEAYRVGCGRDAVLAKVWADKPALPGGQ